MEVRLCQRCGKALKEEDLRYIVEIKVYAAPKEMEINLEDLIRDYKFRINRVVEEIAQKSEKELSDEIYTEWKFDLCPECHKEYIKDPLGINRSENLS